MIIKVVDTKAKKKRKANAGRGGKTTSVIMSLCLWPSHFFVWKVRTEGLWAKSWERASLQLSAVLRQLAFSALLSGLPGLPHLAWSVSQFRMQASGRLPDFLAVLIFCLKPHATTKCIVTFCLFLITFPTLALQECVLSPRYHRQQFCRTPQQKKDPYCQPFTLLSSLPLPDPYMNAVFYGFY